MPRNYKQDNSMKVTRKQIAPNMWQTTVEEPSDALLALCRRLRAQKLQRKEEIKKRQYKEEEYVKI